MGNKRTPGNWQQHDADYCPLEVWGNLEGQIDGSIRGTQVCDVLTNAADARLIAAAPTMLGALERIVIEAEALVKVVHGTQPLPDNHACSACEILHVARAAMSKAA